MAKKKVKKQIKTKKIKKPKKIKRIKQAAIPKMHSIHKRKTHHFKVNPIIAGFLNFFIWGSGYVFNGRFLFGILWIMAATCLMIPFTQILPVLTTSIAGYMSTGYLLISALLAWDAYRYESRKISFY